VLELVVDTFLRKLIVENN